MTTERGGARAADRLWFYEEAERMRAMLRSTRGLEEALVAAVDFLLSTLGCDRAGTIYPCDADARSWSLTILRVRPGIETPDGGHEQRDTTEEASALFRSVSQASEPVRLSVDDGTLRGPALLFGARSVLATWLQPKGTMAPALLAIGDDTARTRRPLEEELVAEVGRELAYTLSWLRVERTFAESEKRAAETARLAQLGYWENDLL